MADDAQQAIRALWAGRRRLEARLERLLWHRRILAALALLEAFLLAQALR